MGYLRREYSNIEGILSARIVGIKVARRKIIGLEKEKKEMGNRKIIRNKM
jgi:hypothetical protein